MRCVETTNAFVLCAFFDCTRRRLTRVSSSDATQTLAGVADKIKNFAIIYLVDINEVRARVSMRANAGERASERRLEKTNKD